MAIWLLSGFQTHGASKIYELQVKNSMAVVMNKALEGCYVIYFCILYYVMLTRGELFREIFDLLQNVSRLVQDPAECKPPSKRKVYAVYT